MLVATTFACVCGVTAHAESFPVDEASIAQIQAAYTSGKATAHEVIQAYLDRIAAYDKRGPYLNSLITVNSKALAEADRLDGIFKKTGKLVGPLHGIPVIVKDNLDTTDMPTSSGVALFKDFVPQRDAFIVSRLRAAGAIVLAKSSLSELAMGLADSINSVLPGFTRNPYNTAFASGGSSGGTGVAVAANLGTVGIGTDTFPHNMVDEIRLACYVARVFTSNYKMGTTRHAFEAATVGGAKILRRPDLGRLAPARCDGCK